MQVPLSFPATPPPPPPKKKNNTKTKTEQLYYGVLSSTSLHARGADIDIEDDHPPIQLNERFTRTSSTTMPPHHSILDTHSLLDTTEDMVLWNNAKIN